MCIEFMKTVFATQFPIEIAKYFIEIPRTHTIRFIAYFEHFEEPERISIESSWMNWKIIISCFAYAYTIYSQPGTIFVHYLSAFKYF